MKTPHLDSGCRENDWPTMPNRGGELTGKEMRAKKRINREFKTVFMNGKQVRIRREPTIDGQFVEEFIRHNADPIWLLQNEMYELLDEHESGKDQTADAVPE